MFVLIWGTGGVHSNVGVWISADSQSHKQNLHGQSTGISNRRRVLQLLKLFLRWFFLQFLLGAFYSAREQAFASVLHEVIASESQPVSGSWAGPVHAEALMLLLPVVLGSSCAGSWVFECWQPWKSGKQQKKGSGGDRDYRWLDMRRKRKNREGAKCGSHLVWRWLPRQFLNKRYISFWGSLLFVYCEFLPHKSVHDSACEDG